jgi:hypothetical protein
MKPHGVVQKLVWKEYGQYTLFDPPDFDSNTNRYFANLRSDYPLFIHDDRTPADYKVRVLKIHSLGSIYLNDNFQVIRELTTSREECDENLGKLLKLWREQAENIVVSCSADILTSMNRFRNHFTQIDIILDFLKEFDKITPIDIKEYPSPKKRIKLVRYIKLLKELDVVREETSGNFVPGRLFGFLEKSADNYDQFKQAVLSHVIKNRYITLRDIFKLTILEKTIGIDNVIYLPELETGEPIHRSRGSIASLYKRYYDRRIDPFRLNNILTELETSGAISRKGPYYFGQEDLREDMLVKKRELPPLSISPLIRYS